MIISRSSHFIRNNIPNISAQQNQQSIQESDQISVKARQVRKVLRGDLNMKFSKVKKISRIDNSDRSLILRQQYAIKMLELLGKPYRIICIDQSWLSDTNFIRRKYKQEGSTNSIEERLVNPRISMIAGVDTEGHVYLSLTQVTTDTEMMKMFLSKLAIQLDNEKGNWREDTVFLFDNATYQSNSNIWKHMNHLQMTVIYSGPASYYASVTELLWGFIKRGNLNEQGLATGKR